MDISTLGTTSRHSEAVETATRSSVGVLGDVAWLMMESAWHKGRQVSDFARLVMPPLKHRQFRLFHEGNVPIAFISWALLSPTAEIKYFTDPHSLDPEDWKSGNAIYIADFVASPNAMRKIAPYLRHDPLMSMGPIRGIKTRNSRRLLVEVFANAAGQRLKVSRVSQ